MKGVLTLFFLLLNIGNTFAENSLIAVVNNKAVTFKSIENKINNTNSYNKKISIIEKHIVNLHGKYFISS